MSERPESEGSAATVLGRLTRAMSRGLSFGGVERKRIHGETILVEHDPALETHHDALFVPQRGRTLIDDAGWGVFDRSGEPIAASFYRRGPGPERVGASTRPPLGSENASRAEETPHVYLGHFSVHYGHFLLTSLARLWPLVRDALPPGCKFIYHAPEPPHLWFSVPFIARILGALGLSEADFVFVAEPTRIGTLLVPEPSFEESHAAHRVHRDLGMRIGHASLPPPADAPERTAQPLYLARTHLGRGTHRITNEDVLIAALADRGFAIAHPEELSLDAQVALFDRHDTVVCLVGSALHTSLLSRRPNGIVGISMQPSLRSDYLLIDKLAGNRARYLFQPFYEEAGEEDGFHRSARFAYPKRVIESVLRAADALA